jgi:hypothetical protein
MQFRVIAKSARVHTRRIAGVVTFVAGSGLLDAVVNVRIEGESRYRGDLAQCPLPILQCVAGIWLARTARRA